MICSWEGAGGLAPTDLEAIARSGLEQLIQALHRFLTADDLADFPVLIKLWCADGEVRGCDASVHDG